VSEQGRQWAIIQGDAREVLAGMDDQSVHCVVTSPPYFGLRSYGTPPLLWGGSDDDDCEHEWGEEPPPKIVGAQRDASGGIGGGRILGTRGEQPWTAGASGTLRQGQFCRLCGCWRGSLGLEPTPDCGRPFQELRPDLTEKEREYVMRRLQEEGLL